MKNKMQRGMSLIELMIAIVVLAIGIGGTTVLLTSTISSDNRSNTDTTGTLLAQMVMEQISAQAINSTLDLNVTDCAGNSWTITTTPGTAGTGNGANLKSDGSVDFTQSQSGLVTAGYAMNYVDCSTAGGVQIAYDVRWNVMSVSGNTTSRLITVAARPGTSNVNQLGGVFFAIPVTLRSIGGASADQ
jgi:prepilin-type N-terminal cleavage/methylation domain-containing protein